MYAKMLKFVIKFTVLVGETKMSFTFSMITTLVTDDGVYAYYTCKVVCVIKSEREIRGP